MTTTPGPAGLASLLAGRDRWAGAACIGQWALFDPRAEDETTDDFRDRVEQATWTCHRCPLIESCHSTAQSLPPRDRAGNWAGTGYTKTGRPIHISKET